MSILILGSQGNLGGQLVSVLADQGIIAWDKSEIDLTNSLASRQKILDLKPQIIINAVAYNAVDKCEESQRELELAYQLNRQAVGNLAQIAQEIGAIFVHYSTDYVFQGNQPEGYLETAEPQPVNKYGQTKLAGEAEILKVKNLKYYLIRTSKLFGPQGSSPLCKPSFFDIMLRLASERPEVSVVDEEVSCFTYTKDLARQTNLLLDSNKEFGIYHIVNSGPATWYQAAKYLFDISQKSVKVKPVSSQEFPRPATRPKYSVLLNTKLPPLRSWQEALKDYLRS